MLEVRVREEGFIEGGGLGVEKGFMEGGGLERNGLLCEQWGGRARLLDGCAMCGGVVEVVGVGEGVVVRVLLFQELMY